MATVVVAAAGVDVLAVDRLWLACGSKENKRKRVSHQLWVSEGKEIPVQRLQGATCPGWRDLASH